MKRLGCTLSVIKVVNPSCYIRVMEIAPQNKVIEIEKDINIEMNEEISKQEEMDEDYVLLDVLLDSCFKSYGG